MKCRGIRGATVAADNTKEAITETTMELLSKMVEANDVIKEDIACVFFTTTQDLNAEFPAVSARKLGWNDVPLLCGNEIPVPNSLERSIRVLLLFNTNKSLRQIVHVYIRGAEVLRPDNAHQIDGESDKA